VRTVHGARARILTRNDAGVCFDICVYAAPMARAGRTSGGVCHRRIENFFGTSLTFWSAVAALCRGAAQYRSRPSEHAIPGIEDALRSWEATGARAPTSYFRFHFATLARADNTRRAMMLVNQAIAELGDERLAELVSFAPFGPNR